MYKFLWVILKILLVLLAIEIIFFVMYLTVV